LAVVVPVPAAASGMVAGGGPVPVASVASASGTDGVAVAADAADAAVAAGVVVAAGTAVATGAFAGPTVFKAGCPECRSSFELTADALRLAVGGSRETTFYSFTCPECGSAVRKPAGERIVELLTGGGVRTLRLHSVTTSTR
jgi:hypothetical protein